MAVPGGYSAPFDGAPDHNVRALRRPSPGSSGNLAILQSIAADDRRVKEAPLRMLVVLGTYADVSTRLITASAKTIGARLGISRQAAQRTLHELAVWGYIEIIDRHDQSSGAQLSSYYRLLMDVSIPDGERRSVRRTRPLEYPELHETGCTPATSEVAPPPESETAPVLHPPATPEVAPPATSDVAVKERPRLTAPVNGREPESPEECVSGANAPTPAPKAARRKPPSRGAAPSNGEAVTLCPDTIELTELSYTSALKMGFDREAVDLELEHFMAKARAKKWTNTDWKQAFRSWLIQEVKWARERGHTVGEVRSASRRANRPTEQTWTGKPGAPIDADISASITAELMKPW